MIIKIDHIALSSRDVDSDIEVLEKLNYKKVFSEKNIPNPKIKEQMLASYSENHDAALLSAGENYSVELVDHRNMTANHSNILAVFNNLSKVRTSPDSHNKQISGSVLSGIRIEDITVPIKAFTKSDGHDFRFNKLVFNTMDIQRSRHFWGCFGFKDAGSAEGIDVLKFNDAFSRQEFFIYLAKDDTANRSSHLDDRGLNCMAFISNRVEQEREILREKNFEITPTENVQINGRDLEIFFARGENGEIAEVIGVKTNR